MRLTASASIWRLVVLVRLAGGDDKTSRQLAHRDVKKYANATGCRQKGGDEADFPVDVRGRFKINRASSFHEWFEWRCHMTSPEFAASEELVTSRPEKCLLIKSSMMGISR